LALQTIERSLPQDTFLRELQTILDTPKAMALMIRSWFDLGKLIIVGQNLFHLHRPQTLVQGDVNRLTTSKKI
jgi:hypothetical protein